MDTTPHPSDVPRWRDAAIFACKAWCLRGVRLAKDLLHTRPQRHASAQAALRDAPVLAESRTALWPGDETDPALVLGKLQNLRRAARHFDGIEPDAGQPVSFWRQVGRANRRKGYAVGRELREGCLIPSLGGGLCQLSNAIHDCAVRAGLTVLERHRHSRVIPGSLAEHDRDATVFWNYIDLRVSAPFAWRLEVALGATELRVAIRAHAAARIVTLPAVVRPRTSADPVHGNCSACGETTCHRHAPTATASVRRRAWIALGDWPEFALHRETWLAGCGRVLPATQRKRGHAAHDTLVGRAMRRYLLWRGTPLPRVQLHAMRRLSSDLALRISIDELDLAVPQALLPWLWREGALGARRFDVLMEALPMTVIQQTLDRAARAHPRSPTLADFRADDAVIEAERDALAAASSWITPHAAIATLAPVRVVLLDWNRPTALARKRPPDAALRVLLPASALARKGVYELREAARTLDANVRIVLPPGAGECADFWKNTAIERVPSIATGIASCDVAALPAWIEHRPRGLLMAMASGVPVVATRACGLHSSMPWHAVEPGDAQGLADALIAIRDTTAVHTAHATRPHAPYAVATTAIPP